MYICQNKSQMNNDILLDLIPEVDDILTFQVTNQLILIKPLKIDVVKSKSGLILSGATGPDGDGGTVDLDKTRSGLPQRAVAIVCGKQVQDIKPGMTVYYYNSALNEIVIRQGEEIYYGIQEYNIKAYIKQ